MWFTTLLLPVLVSWACATAPTAPEASAEPTPREAAPEASAEPTDAPDEAPEPEAAPDTPTDAREAVPEPHPFTWKVWAVHARTGQRFDALREHPDPDEDELIPVRGPLTIELTLLEGPAPTWVKLTVDAKHKGYRRRSKTFEAKVFEVGQPVTWDVPSAGLMLLKLECAERSCPDTSVFPLWLIPR